MDCALLERFVDSYVDDEFAEAERLESDAHLASCSDCRRLVQQRANEKTLLRTATPRLPAPEALRRRIGEMLDHLDSSAPEIPALPAALPAPAPVSQRRWSRSPWLARLALPAALLVLPALSYWYGQRETALLADTVAKHQRNLPVEITGDPQVVLSWFNGKVPFAVRPPHLEPTALLRGGRLVNLGSHEAAYLLYERPAGIMTAGRAVSNRPLEKISVFVFDAPDMPLASPRHQMVGSHEVFLQGTHGYNVAMFRDRGLDYAITGDIDEPELLRLISTAVSGR